MQYQLTPRSKWKMHHHCEKIRSQNVQILGYVYQNTNGLNHGPERKIQSFFLSEICTVILWQDHYEIIRESSLGTRLGKRVPNWECFFVNREKGPFLSSFVDDVKLAGKKRNIDPNVEKYS